MVESKFNIIMESISAFFKEEKDYFYLKGEAKGKLEGEARGILKGKAKGKLEGIENSQRTIIRNLLENFNFSEDEAARATNASLEFVRRVKADSAKK